MIRSHCARFRFLVHQRTLDLLSWGGTRQVPRCFLVWWQEGLVYVGPSWHEDVWRPVFCITGAILTQSRSLRVRSWGEGTAPPLSWPLPAGLLCLGPDPAQSVCYPCPYPEGNRCCISEAWCTFKPAYARKVCGATLVWGWISVLQWRGEIFDIDQYQTLLNMPERQTNDFCVSSNL